MENYCNYFFKYFPVNTFLPILELVAYFATLYFSYVIKVLCLCCSFFSISVQRGNISILLVQWIGVWVTAVTQVQSLAQELPHAVGTIEKKRDRERKKGVISKISSHFFLYCLMLLIELFYFYYIFHYRNFTWKRSCISLLIHHLRHSCIYFYWLIFLLIESYFYDSVSPICLIMTLLSGWCTLECLPVLVYRTLAINFSLLGPMGVYLSHVESGI